MAISRDIVDIEHGIERMTKNLVANINDLHRSAVHQFYFHLTDSSKSPGPTIGRKPPSPVNDSTTGGFDTGRMRSNWNVNPGKPDSSTNNVGENNPLSEPQVDSLTRRKLKTCQSQLMKRRLQGINNDVSIANGVEYIDYVNKAVGFKDNAFQNNAEFFRRAMQAAWGKFVNESASGFDLDTYHPIRRNLNGTIPAGDD